MRLFYINESGNKIVTAFASQEAIGRFNPVVSSMTHEQFQQWAAAQVDPQGLHSVTILADDDPIPTTPEEDFESLVKEYDRAIEKHLHVEAMAHGYTNIERACMYAPYPNPYQAESQSFVEWVGAVWAHCFEQLRMVKEGIIPTPTLESTLAGLPQRVPPAA